MFSTVKLLHLDRSLHLHQAGPPTPALSFDLSLLNGQTGCLTCACVSAAPHWLLLGGAWPPDCSEPPNWLSSLHRCLLSGLLNDSSHTFEFFDLSSSHLLCCFHWPVSL